jgi:hypothetical protein
LAYKHFRRNDVVAAEDMEAGVRHLDRKHGNHFFGNLPFGEERPEHLVPEDGLLLFQLQGRGGTTRREKLR